MFKYEETALGADGCVYGIPFNANQVVRIDPDTETVRPFGPNGITGYDSSVLAPEDGFIYCAPDDASRMLRIDTCL